MELFEDFDLSRLASEGKSEDSFLGVFETKMNYRRNKHVVYEIHALSHDDENFIQCYPVPDGARIYRMKNEKTRIVGISPFIMINYKSGKVHFLDMESKEDDETLRFDRGCAIRYLKASELWLKYKPQDDGN